MNDNASSACPVCNGFSDLSLICKDCGALLEDHGRFQDQLAEYSPYRPIEDMKKSDGWIDLITQTCPHQVYCSQCGQSDVKFIAEISI